MPTRMQLETHCGHSSLRDERAKTRFHYEFTEGHATQENQEITRGRFVASAIPAEEKVSAAAFVLIFGRQERTLELEGQLDRNMPATAT